MGKIIARKAFSGIGLNRLYHEPRTDIYDVWQELATSIDSRSRTKWFDDMKNFFDKSRVVTINLIEERDCYGEITHGILFVGDYITFEEIENYGKSDEDFIIVEPEDGKHVFLCVAELIEDLELEGEITPVYGVMEKGIDGEFYVVNNETKITTIERKEEKNMLGIKGLDCGVVKDNKVRISHLGIAVKNKSGVFVAYDKTKDDVVDVDMLDIGMEDMLYNMPMAIKDISKGDVIAHNGKPVIVRSVSNGIQVIDVEAGEEKVIHPTKSMFGFDFVTKYVTLIDFSAIGGQGADENNPFGSMLPLLMMSGNKGSKGMSSMLPLMLMSGGTMDMSNPLMMMAMMGGEEKDSMLPLLLMSGGLGNLGGAPKVAEVAEPTVSKAEFDEVRSQLDSLLALVEDGE